MDTLNEKPEEGQISIDAAEDWWPFDDGDGVEDAEELEMLRDSERGEWRSVSNLAEEMERARAIARATMATWSEEQLAEVRRRVGAHTNGVPKPPPSLAGGGDTGDNPPQATIPERLPGGGSR